MAETRITNIVTPVVFAPYVTEAIAQHSALIAAGIVVPDPSLDKLAQSGGVAINIPFFKDLTGVDEVLSDSAALAVNNITTGQDVAKLLMRGKAWGANDLAKAVSGADPMGAIANLVAGWWVKQEQATLVQMLTGVFADNAANDAGDLIKNVALETLVGQAEANWMSGANVIAAAGLLGDQLGVIKAMCMHSVPYMRLQTLQLIDYVSATQEERAATGQDQVPTFLGKRVIVDDTCPVVAGSTSGFKYTTYLFAQGAIARGEGSAPVPVETDRNSLAGYDVLIHRRHFILHPRGIKNTATAAGASPTNAEMAVAGAWDRVYPKKTIRIVSLITNG